MWDQYKKTFIGMQIVILLVTAGMFIVLSRDVTLVATFYASLQVAALLGLLGGPPAQARAGNAGVKGGL